MIDDGKGDWRIAHVLTLAKDVPPAFPGGPSHKAGDHLYVSNLAQHEQHRFLGFATPHASALALNVAFTAGRQASETRQAIPLQDSLTPHGKGKSVTTEGLPALYDFFEQSMISVIFSYLAVETFANSLLSLHPNAVVTLPRNAKTIRLTGAEAERDLSTTEKVAQALPQILGRPTPKGRKPWPGFVRLRRARDATVHLKSVDMYTRRAIDKHSLYFQFLNDDPLNYPIYAHTVVSWFMDPKDEPRWSVSFRQRISPNR